MGERGIERLTTILVHLSAAAAVVGLALLGRRPWLPSLSLATFLTGAIASWLAPRAGSVLLLGFTYLIPAAFLATVGHYEPVFHVVWLAALFGAVTGGRRTLDWAFPSRVRAPLAFWALVVAVSWPLVVWRELDFSLPLLNVYHLANSGIGGPPPVIAVWIMLVALTHLLGLLWFDHLFQHFRLDTPRVFQNAVIVPLAISAALASAVGIYQGLVDVSWLSGSLWPGLHRAAGTMLDSPAFGSVAGLWTAGFLALSAQASGGFAVLGVVGSLLSWAGLWASGSRMGLLAGAIGLVFTFVAAGRELRRPVFRVAVIVALTLCAAVIVTSSRWRTASPVARISAVMPAPTWAGIEQFGRDQLWNRGAPFGSAFLAMLKDSPVVGVGVGSFNHFFPDYGFVLVGWRVPFENAQSWYRQHLAELGVVGSIGWLAWVAVMAWLMVKAKAEPETRFAGTTIKGALVALAIVSAVSMPAQNIAVSVTVWALIFWWLVVTPDAARRLTAGPEPQPWMWRTLLAVAIAHAGYTTYVGWTQLRPPYRALHADWEYVRGLGDRESSSGEAFRWTTGHAIDVIAVPASAHWLRLGIEGGPPDIRTRPMVVTVSRNGRKVIEIAKDSDSLDTWFLRVPDDGNRVMIEVRCSRTWRPADYGASRDRRELGVRVLDWAFVAGPPAGAKAIF